MSTESTQLAPTQASPTSSLRGSMFITMRLVVANTFQELFWLTWSLGPWTVLGLVPLELSSDQTTSCLDSLELETIGQRDTTLKVFKTASILL